MRRDRLVAVVLTVIVLALAAFSMWVILLRMRPLDPEMFRAPVITSNLPFRETAA
jgi:hypothetical protein